MPMIEACADAGVRVQVLTSAAALDRGKQFEVVRQSTDLVATAVGGPSQAERTRVLLSEALGVIAPTIDFSSNCILKIKRF
jgi:hypothetical protein